MWNLRFSSKSISFKYGKCLKYEKDDNVTKTFKKLKLGMIWGDLTLFREITSSRKILISTLKKFN